MKNAHNIFLKGMLFFLITMGSNAQKTGVQVNFSIHSEEAILFSFEEDQVEDLQKKIQTSIIKEFNEYIAFLDFKEESSDYTLQVTLRSFVDDSGFFNTYKLLFGMENAAGTELEHSWLFLDINEAIAATASTETLWDSFEGKWSTHVKEAYNKDFVASLFHEIAVTTPDKVHYHETTSLKEVILPFDLKYLNIDPDQSEFRALVNCTIDGVDSTCPIERASYGGIVNGEMEVPSIFDSCIRIRLDGTNLNALSDGKIFITSYRYRSYPNEEIESPNSFMGSITD